MNTITNGKYTFEIVEKIPSGYQIWNIGRNMIDGYLPLAMCGGYDGCQVDTRTLKAIKVAGAQTILDAVGGGQGTVEEMETYVKRYKNAKPGTWSYKQVKRMKEALKVMSFVKGIENLCYAR